MKAITPLACNPFGSYRPTNLYLQKKMKANSLQDMQKTDMGLGMPVDILMNFMHAKFLIAT